MTSNPQNGVSDTARLLAQQEYESNRKKGIVAWLLWLFLGALGAHRFYFGHTVYAIAMLLTAGGLGVWALIDAFFINRNLRSQNLQLWNRVCVTHSIPTEPLPESAR